MIIDKITLTEEEQRERAELNKRYLDAVKRVQETTLDMKTGGMTFEHVMEQDGVEEALNHLTTIGAILELHRREAEARHMKELGTSEAILAEAKEVIQALEKKDFQNFIRVVRTGKKSQTEEMKRDKMFQATLKRYTYTFESAYRFIITQVKPYERALKDLDEKTELTLADGNIESSYLDLLKLEALRKARDDFGYTPKSERKKRGQKQTVSLKEELTAVEDIEETDLYNKSISDSFARSIEASIGEKPTTDKISQYRIIETKHGQFMFTNEDQDLLEKVDEKAVTTETVLIMNMLWEKLLLQIPTLKVYKGKLKEKEQAELDQITEKLLDEKVRTVTLTLGEYMDRRKSKGRKATAKSTIEYALKSVGSMEAIVGGKKYYMFSSKPQEMYKAGNVEAVFNIDWCKRLYTDESKIVNFPEPLYSVDLRKHPHAVMLWIWLRQNYEANTYKQNPNTNRVKISTTIENIPALKDNYEQEKTVGNARYWQRVIEPLLTSLDALKKIYGLLDYEILDKNLNKISASKFNKISMDDKLECWIRYELTGYPRWKAPEQLTGKKKK